MQHFQIAPLNPLPENYAESLVLRLLSCPGTTGREGPIAELIKKELIDIGMPENCIFQDAAHKKISLPTPCGNLIVRMKGKSSAPFFSAPTWIRCHFAKVPNLSFQPIDPGFSPRENRTRR